MKGIETKRANANKPKAKKVVKVVSFQKDVMTRFNELKELIGNADPKALAKLPDNIKTVFGL